MPAELPVEHNRGCFPGDFMFQPTTEEKAKVVANCEHLSKPKYSLFRRFQDTETRMLTAATEVNLEKSGYGI